MPSRVRFSIWVLVLSGTALAATLSCNDDSIGVSDPPPAPPPPPPPPPGAPTVVSVSVTPATDSVIQGDTLRLTATPKDSAGQPLIGRLIAWSTDAPSVVTVSDSGRVTGVSKGAATITATVEGIKGTAAITVVVINLEGVWDWTEHIAGGGQVCDDTGSYALRQTGEAFVGRSDQTGSCLDGGEVRMNEEIGNAVGSGVVNARAVTFTVGTSCNYDATTFGGHVPDSLVGLVSCGGGIGTGTWRAVPARPVATGALSPDTMHVIVSWPRLLRFVLHDALGNRVFRAVSWTISAPSVATVDSIGAVTGLSVGSASFIAAVGTVADTASVDVGSLRVAFLSNQDGTTQVYAMNSDGSDLQQLTQGIDWGVDTSPFSGMARLAWSPDRSKLALSGPGVAVINAGNGADHTFVSDNGLDAAWSPDGSRIRLIEPGASSITVYDVTPDGSDTTLVATPNYTAPTTPNDSAQSAARFAFSPDLSRVVFQRTSTHFFTSVYAANTDGTGLRKLTPSGYAEGGPAWSPDGTRIALVDCSIGIAVINSDGSGPLTPLHTNGCSESGSLGVSTRLVWSPDGDYIVFGRVGLGPIGELWVVDTSGGPPHRITPAGFDAWAPAVWH